ncbi:MAG: outer membrane protein assembly factor BamA [Verrucomicrobia bacterium]|nr:outer membrane protein assembly factor BamA [Verrucomicrobiota bacterium]MBU1909631.1 outer membrane protein assembly factor BamA [Verrucomicrobiota bacterium]
MTPRFVRRTILVLLAFLGASPLRAAVVTEIGVRTQGYGVVDTNAVMGFATLQVGEEYSAMAVSRDVRAMQQSGLFASVSVEAQPGPGGVSVFYVVEGRPRMRDLEIVGAEELGNRKVRTLMVLGPGEPVDDSLLAVRSQNVLETYRKKYFPDARLTWKITPAEEAGWVNVRITVKEGRRATVKQIRFSGNRKVKARDLLKVMKQRRVNWLSWITGAGTYDPDALETDRESLRQVYHARGYLDAEIVEPEIKPVGRRGLRVRIAVNEGAAYRIGSVMVSGITSAPPAEVEAVVRLKRGDVASTTGMEKNAQAVRDWYGSRGRIRTDVRVDLVADPKTRQADVQYQVEEGREARIQEIRIRGNSRTKDKVLRRELAVYPGELYNEVKVRTSERRLLNLNYFEYVNSYPSPTDDPGWYDLNIEVEEQRTGQLMAGAGFSSVDDLIGFVELGQGNFDLFGWPSLTGGGQKLKLRAQFGTKRSDYELSFIEPWFLNRRLSLGVDLFSHESRYYSSLYDQKNVGGSLTLGHALGAFSRVNLTYNLQQIDIFNVSSNASTVIQEEAGQYTKSALTLELVRDSRDHPFIPSRGNRSSVSATVAGGFLGAETDLYGFEARTSQFVPLWFDHVFNIRGWAGVVENYGDSDRVPLFDRHFLGGPRTIRGFKYRDVGPHDENGEPIGGLTAGFLTTEYTLPVAEKVRLAFFYDVGMVWEQAWDADLDHLNSGLGFGVRFDLPGFPIQLDYTWPIDTDPENERAGGRFSFWIGYVY